MAVAQTVFSDVEQLILFFTVKTFVGQKKAAQDTILSEASKMSSSLHGPYIGGSKRVTMEVSKIYKDVSLRKVLF